MERPKASCHCHTYGLFGLLYRTQETNQNNKTRCHKKYLVSHFHGKNIFFFYKIIHCLFLYPPSPLNYYPNNVMYDKEKRRGITISDKSDTRNWIFGYYPKLTTKRGLTNSGNSQRHLLLLKMMAFQKPETRTYLVLDLEFNPISRQFQYNGIPGGGDCQKHSKKIFLFFYVDFLTFDTSFCQ